MDKILVEGGHYLEGDVVISGAKNAALPILVSALLTDGWNEFKNVPALKDIESTKQLLQHLGASVERHDDTVRINAAGLNNPEAPYALILRTSS